MRRSRKEQTLSAMAAAAIVAGGTVALVLGLSFVPSVDAPQRALETILPTRNTPPAPSPTPTPPPRSKPSSAKAGAPRDEPAPASRKNEAAQIVLPPPRQPPLPPPPPVPTAPEAGTGSAANQGTAKIDGAGRGTGGAGSGTGGGGSGGSGSGAGFGRGDLATYPRQIAGKLHYWEIPKELRRHHGGVVRLRYRIGVDGRVSDCRVLLSSGFPEFDRKTCARITDRFRFKPARGPDGRPVPFVMTETHGWDYEPDR
ncbi:energy transducer TonB [Novosphingobium malaysiense]|uniref:TonB C-terminal domain-containing protein n=1 Tax=Novosphingobium malaysiense TaxID=1348853 RepID=A0A0B1ZN39_9SPHN|nr:energy transducer TonB [Novosphingobium malaysiense]KHK90574.1 hypothetical protein LK12_14625 [Novosphingobium malaysiense]